METKRKCDITNLLQATCDILVKYKILEDDNYSIVSSFEGTRAEYCKENSRVEIEITKKEN
jgi:Holliday junction resolvase RusA-like endonuclease